MGVSMKVDPISQRKLNKKFKVLSKAYPEEMFRAIVKILFDIKLIAQKKLDTDRHWVTGRLINSIFVKTPKQKFANMAGNKKTYTNDEGDSFRGDLNVNLRGAEGAVGTNVVYANKIEKLDSYLEYGVKTANFEKRFDQAAKRAEKKAKK